MDFLKAKRYFVVIPRKDIGFFIRGFLCAEESADQNDDFDTFFKEKFGKFVREKFEVELTEFEFWFETIEKKAKDNE